MLITLAEQHFATDDAEANRDHQRVIDGKWNDGPGGNYMPPGGLPQRLDYRIKSYRAERCFAHALQYDYRRDPNGFAQADVAGYSVRMASEPGYGLVIFPKDPVAPYVLMTCFSPTSYELTGVLSHRAAYLFRVKGIGFKLEGDKLPWCIPYSLTSPPILVGT